MLRGNAFKRELTAYASISFPLLLGRCRNPTTRRHRWWNLNQTGLRMWSGQRCNRTWYGFSSGACRRHKRARGQPVNVVNQPTFLLATSSPSLSAFRPQFSRRGQPNAFPGTANLISWESLVQAGVPTPTACRDFRFPESASRRCPHLCTCKGLVISNTLSFSRPVFTFNSIAPSFPCDSQTSCCAQLNLSQLMATTVCESMHRSRIQAQCGPMQEFKTTTKPF